MSLAADLRSFVIDNFLLGRQEELNNDDSFLEQGIIDSTGILELVAHLEETYGIEITENELTPDNLDSINRIVAYLSIKLGNAATTNPVAASNVPCPA